VRNWHPAAGTLPPGRSRKYLAGTPGSPPIPYGSHHESGYRASRRVVCEMSRPTWSCVYKAESATRDPAEDSRRSPTPRSTAANLGRAPSAQAGMPRRPVRAQAPSHSGRRQSANATSGTSFADQQAPPQRSARCRQLDRSMIAKRPGGPATSRRTPTCFPIGLPAVTIPCRSREAVRLPQKSGSLRRKRPSRRTTLPGARQSDGAGETQKLARSVQVFLAASAEKRRKHIRRQRTIVTASKALCGVIDDLRRWLRPVSKE
jgi:hypothetical protein